MRFTVLGGISFLYVKTDVSTIPGLLVVPHTDIDNVASPTLGAEVPIMLGSHVAVVPTLRVHAFVLRRDDTSGFAIRPGVALRWMQ